MVLIDDIRKSGFGLRDRGQSATEGKAQQTPVQRLAAENDEMSKLTREIQQAIATRAPQKDILKLLDKLRQATDKQTADLAALDGSVQAQAERVQSLAEAAGAF